MLEIVPALDGAGELGDNRHGKLAALHLGDLVSHRLHIEHPAWLPVWDLAREAQVLASREAVLRLAVESDAVVTASHLPTPGRVGRAHGTQAWTPVGSDL